MKNFYYATWGDMLNRGHTNPDPVYKSQWKWKSYFFVTLAHSLNIYAFNLIVKAIWGYELPMFDWDFGWRIGGALAFFITFGLPMAIVNYFLVFHKKRYLKIMKKYPETNPSIGAIYALSALFGALLVSFIYGFYTGQI